MRRLVLAVALVLACSGCLTRTLRTPVVEERGLEIFLRGQKKGGQAIDRGFEHPASIAPVRMAHILSRVDVRVDKKKAPERAPAIPTNSLFAIADGVSKALAAADSSQQVVVMLVRREKRFVLFDHYFLTSFLAYIRGDRLFLHFSRIDWEVPPSREKKRLPEPHEGKKQMKFSVHAGNSMMALDSQSLMVDWRDDVFKRPTAMQTLPGGRVVRRTILMESLPEDEDDLGSGDPASRKEPAPEDLSPKTLRDLADLAEQRAQGVISEGEFEVRRRQILRADPSAN